MALSVDIFFVSYVVGHTESLHPLHMYLSMRTRIPYTIPLFLTYSQAQSLDLLAFDRLSLTMINSSET